MEQIASNALDLVVILGLHRDAVVRREPPGVERYGSS